MLALLACSARCLRPRLPLLGCLPARLLALLARLFPCSAVYPLGCLSARYFPLGCFLCSLFACSAVYRLPACSARYFPLGCSLCSLYACSAVYKLLTCSARCFFVLLTSLQRLLGLNNRHRYSGQRTCSKVVFEKRVPSCSILCHRRQSTVSIRCTISFSYSIIPPYSSFATTFGSLIEAPVLGSRRRDLLKR